MDLTGFKTRRSIDATGARNSCNTRATNRLSISLATQCMLCQRQVVRLSIHDSSYGDNTCRVKKTFKNIVITPRPRRMQRSTINLLPLRCRKFDNTAPLK